MASSLPERPKRVLFIYDATEEELRIKQIATYARFNNHVAIASVSISEFKELQDIANGCHQDEQHFDGTYTRSLRACKATAVAGI